MPALSIYDTEGNRIGDDTGSGSERIEQFGSNGGRLTLDASGETTRVVVLFSARESASSSPGQYYAVYQGNPQKLHAALQKRLQEAYGLELVPDDETSVYDLFVPGETTVPPGETEQLDRVASLLTDDESETPARPVKLGVESYPLAEQVVQYFLGEGYASQMAVTENIDSPELRGFELAVEQGGYDGIEILPETERKLGGSERPTRSGWSFEGAQRRREEELEEDDEDDRSTAVLLGAVGAVAVLVLLALGTAFAGGLPFVGGDGGGGDGGGGGGGGDVTLDLDTAELRGADGVIVEGQLAGGSVDGTSFTVELWEGQQDNGQPVVSRQVDATDSGGGFSLGVDASDIDAATDNFAYLGGTEYEVVVETEAGLSATATLERGPLNLTLGEVTWTDEALTVTGSMTQGGAAIRGDPAIELSLNGTETVTPNVSHESDGTVVLTVSNNQTERNLTAGGTLSITAVSQGVEDTITAQRTPPGDPTESAVFEVTVVERTSPVTAGETVSVTAEITNTGEVAATQTVALSAGPLGSESVTLALESGESISQTFTVDTTAGDAGTYSLNVASENNTDGTTVTVEPQQTGPEFAVQISGTNTPVTAGQALTVSVNITNTGEDSGTQSIEFEAGVLGSDNATVTLASGDSTTETFTITTSNDAVGEYVVGVGSEDDSDTEFVVVEGDGGGGDPQNGSLAVAIEDTNAPVTAGEELLVTVGVTNTGDEQRTGDIGVDAGALGNESESVSVSAGATTTRTFTFGTGTDDAGSYFVTATSATSGDSAEVTVQGNESGGPSLQVAILDTNQPVEGNPIELTFEATNTGESSTTGTVSVSTSPPLGTESTAVTLGPGESTEGTFSIGTGIGAATQYEVTVASDDDEDSTVVTVEQATEASFEVAIAGTNGPVPAGQTLQVIAQVTNTGDTGGTETVTLTTSPAIGSDSAEVTLGPGESTEQSLSVGTEAGVTGEYEVTVAGGDDEATTSVTVEEATAGVFAVAITGTSGPVTAGDPLDVTAEITNTGDTSGTRTVTLTTDPSLGERSTEVTLGPGESTEETLSVGTGAEAAGEYEVTVASEGDEASTTVTVETGAAFEVAIAGTNAPVTAGEDLSVTAEITNTGDTSGTGTVEVAVGELGSASTQVTLSAEQSTTETLTVATEAGEAGEYTATLASGDDEDTASVTVDPAPAEVALSGLDIAGEGSSASIVEGASQPVAVDVTNVGGQPFDNPVEVEVSIGFVSSTATAAPAPGETETVTIDGATDDILAGGYDVTAEAGDAAVSGSLSVDPPVALSGLNIAGQGESATITAGDDEGISVSVENVGPEAAAFDVTLSIEGPSSTVGPITQSTEEIQPGVGFVLSFEAVTGDLPAGEYTVSAQATDYGNDVSVGGSLTVEQAGAGTAGSETARLRAC
jgi:hypothetical protein